MDELTRAAGRGYRLEPTDLDRATTVVPVAARVQDVRAGDAELSFRVDDDDGLVAARACPCGRASGDPRAGARERQPRAAVLRAHRRAGRSDGMTGALIAYRWELRKLTAQKRTWLGIAAAALVPVIFLVSIQISKVTPATDRTTRRWDPTCATTGLALNLVVFKLIGVIGPTLIAALVAGDIVAGEDMGGTLKTILVRSLRRERCSPARHWPC